MKIVPPSAEYIVSSLDLFEDFDKLILIPATTVHWPMNIPCRELALDFGLERDEFVFGHNSSNAFSIISHE